VFKSGGKMLMSVFDWYKGVWTSLIEKVKSWFSWFSDDDEEESSSESTQSTQTTTQQIKENPAKYNDAAMYNKEIAEIYAQAIDEEKELAKKDQAVSQLLNASFKNLIASNKFLSGLFEETIELQEEQIDLDEEATKPTSPANSNTGASPNTGAAPGASGSDRAQATRSGSVSAASKAARARAAKETGRTAPSASGAADSGSSTQGSSKPPSPGGGQKGQEATPDSGGTDSGDYKRTAGPGNATASATGKPKGGGGGNMSEQDIKNMIIKHEGIRYRPYKDSLGLWTVGVGHLIGDGKTLPQEYNREFSEEEVMAMFEKDYIHHRKAAEKIPGFNNANGRGQGALTDLTFNMGPTWYKGWPNFQKHLAAGNADGAAASLESSKWYGQVGNRAPVIVDHIRNGIQAAEGGVFNGPKSGYPATLHGEEAVVPLKGGNIPVEMGNASQTEMINLLSSLNSKMEHLVALNSAIADLNSSQLKAQKKMGNTELLV
jgi:lysozyme